MTTKDEFEEWAIKEGLAVDIFMDDQYPYRSTQAAWNAWQARQQEIDDLKLEVESLNLKLKSFGNAKFGSVIKPFVGEHGHLWNPEGEKIEHQEWTDQDTSFPEDDEIKSVRPLTTNGCDIYAEAERMACSKNSKGARIDLVNWLLVRIDQKIKSIGLKDEIIDALKAEIEKLNKWTDGDQILPEDDEIEKSITISRKECSKGKDTYSEALRLVGAKRSKGALVALVNWLLVRIDEKSKNLPEDVLATLRFYGNGEHFYIDPEGDGFDTVSGEPENWLCSLRNGDATMFENGGIARAILRGETILDGIPTSPPIEGGLYRAVTRQLSDSDVEALALKHVAINYFKGPFKSTPYQKTKQFLQIKAMLLDAVKIANGGSHD